MVRSVVLTLRQTRIQSLKRMMTSLHLKRSAARRRWWFRREGTWTRWSSSWVVICTSAADRAREDWDYRARGDRSWQREGNQHVQGLPSWQPGSPQVTLDAVGKEAGVPMPADTALPRRRAERRVQACLPQCTRPRRVADPADGSAYTHGVAPQARDQKRLDSGRSAWKAIWSLRRAKRCPWVSAVLRERCDGPSLSLRRPPGARKNGWRSQRRVRSTEPNNCWELEA